MAHKFKDIEDGYCRGLNAAQRIVREGGVEALDEEIRFRNRNNISLPATRAELNVATQPMRHNLLQSVLAMSILTLRDEFGFGRKRAEQFLDRFLFKSECLGDKFLDWKDVHDIILEELGMDLEINVMREQEKNRKLGDR